MKKIQLLVKRPELLEILKDIPEFHNLKESDLIPKREVSTHKDIYHSFLLDTDELKNIEFVHLEGLCRILYFLETRKEALYYINEEDCKSPRLQLYNKYTQLKKNNQIDYNEFKNDTKTLIEKHPYIQGTFLNEEWFIMDLRGYSKLKLEELNQLDLDTLLFNHSSNLIVGLNMFFDDCFFKNKSNQIRYNNWQSILINFTCFENYIASGDHVQGYTLYKLFRHQGESHISDTVKKIRCLPKYFKEIKNYYPLTKMKTIKLD